MKKNYFKYLLFVIAILFINLVSVSAADLTVTSNNGTALLKYSKGIAFYIGKTNSKSSMYSVALHDFGTDTTDVDGDGNKTEKKLNPYYGYVDSKNGIAVVSLPNGKYYAYASSSTGSSSGVVAFTVSGGCSDEPKTNQKGTFSVNKCAARHSADKDIVFMNSSVATCADGYVEDATKRAVDSNACNTLTFNYSSTYGTYTLPQKYCKVTYVFTCVAKDSGEDEPDDPEPVAAAKLTKLSVSSGTLSPTFKSGTKKYTVNVASNVTSVKISATAASGSSFVSKYGPRTVSNLTYGKNTVYVKVKNSANKTTTYTITINRADDRSTVNTLSNLTVSSGTLSPAFNSSTTNYSVDVPSETTSITVNATLTDNKSKFVSGFGPTTVNLEPGPNQVYVKVVNEKGATNVYTITVNRATLPSICTTDTSNLALLKDLKFANKIDGVEALTLDNFDSKVFVYNDINVPNAISDLMIDTYFVDEGDTAVVENNKNLKVNESRTITITVTSKQCPNYSNIYTLNVMRQSEEQKGKDAELSNITIANHDEFEFSPEKQEYGIVLKKSETELEISYEKVDATADCVVDGNHDLKYDSKVTISCTSEDGNDKKVYTIVVNGVEKEKNGFLIIILVIIIILILIYLVLRLLGYRIYFNVAVIGAFFRGIGEKFKNMFDK